MEGRACCPSRWMDQRPFFGNSRFEAHSVHETDTTETVHYWEVDKGSRRGQVNRPGARHTTGVSKKVTMKTIKAGRRMGSTCSRKTLPLPSRRKQTKTVPVAHCDWTMRVVLATLDETGRMFQATEFRADWQISDRAYTTETNHGNLSHEPVLI